MKGHLVTFEITTHLKNEGKTVISGWQFCCSCYKTAKQTQNDTCTDDSNNTSDDGMLDLHGGLPNNAEKNN